MNPGFFSACSGCSNQRPSDTGPNRKFDVDHNIIVMSSEKLDLVTGGTWVNDVILATTIGGLPKNQGMGASVRTIPLLNGGSQNTDLDPHKVEIYFHHP